MNTRLVSAIAFSLLISLALAAPDRQAWAQAKASGARFALVIGNAKYPDNDAPLKDAVGDAQEMAKELRRSGFDVEAGENLSKDAMRGALDRFFGKIRSGSTALIFFSGFGIQSNRQSYMIPVDGQVWTENDVRKDGFSIDTMLAEMNTRGAGVKIAILNASRRNPFERRFRPVSSGLAPVIAPRDTMIVYSAAPGTVVNESNATHSIFVTEMVKQMREPSLSGEEVFTRTRIGVSRASNGEQTPWFSSSLAQEFYFSQDAKRIASAPPPPAESRPAPAPAPAADPDADARRDYQRAGQIGTRKAWDDFLDKHPSGRYSTLAHEQIAKLEPPRETPKPAEPVAAPPVAKPPVSSKDGEDLRELEKRIDKNPKDAKAHYQRGILYAKLGEFGHAIKDFNEVLRGDPKDAEALNNRCWARAMLDELQTALKDCDEALRIRPQFSDALDSRGLVKLKIGLPRNAISDYDASLRINANQASSLYGRGIAKMRSGNESGGNSDVAAAKSINPKIAEEFAGYGIR